MAGTRHGVIEHCAFAILVAGWLDRIMRATWTASTGAVRVERDGVRLPSFWFWCVDYVRRTRSVGDTSGVFNGGMKAN